VRFLPAVVVAKRRSARREQAESERRGAADAGVAPIEPGRPVDDLHQGRLWPGEAEDQGVSAPAALLGDDLLDRRRVVDDRGDEGRHVLRLTGDGRDGFLGDEGRAVLRLGCGRGRGDGDGDEGDRSSGRAMDVGRSGQGVSVRAPFFLRWTVSRLGASIAPPG